MHSTLITMLLTGVAATLAIFVSASFAKADDIVNNDAMEVVDRTGHIHKVYLDADTVGTGQLATLVQTILKGQN